MNKKKTGEYCRGKSSKAFSDLDCPGRIGFILSLVYLRGQCSSLVGSMISSRQEYPSLLHWGNSNFGIEPSLANLFNSRAPIVTQFVKKNRKNSSF